MLFLAVLIIVYFSGLFSEKKLSTSSHPHQKQLQQQQQQQPQQLPLPVSLSLSVPPRPPRLVTTTFSDKDISEFTNNSKLLVQSDNEYAIFEANKELTESCNLLKKYLSQKTTDKALLTFSSFKYNGQELSLYLDIERNIQESQRLITPIFKNLFLIFLQNIKKCNYFGFEPPSQKEIYEMNFRYFTASRRRGTPYWHKDEDSLIVGFVYMPPGLKEIQQQDMDKKVSLRTRISKTKSQVGRIRGLNLKYGQMMLINDTKLFHRSPTEQQKIGKEVSTMISISLLKKNRE